MSDDLVFRDLAGMAEMQAAEALQRAVWGEGDKEDPADLMMVVQQEGGLVAGAFAGERLAAYLFAFPTATPGVQHSHRLAVHPDFRGRGLGLRLKLHQRDWARAHGIHLVRWTFDPLRHVNASLNIGRLGATARTYYENYYGAMAGINAGPPSDRLLAEWVVDRELPTPALPLRQTLTIPEDFERLSVEDPAAAHAERLRVRAALTESFASGLVVTGYDAATRTYRITG